MAQIPVQVKGRSLNNPPPPLRPCRCHSRGSFPRLTSVRNSSGTFPENFRKFFGTFRTFSVTSSAHYLWGFATLRSFFVTFSNIFRYFPNVFRNISNIFRYISGIFCDTFGPVPVARSDHCVTIPGTLNVAEPQPVVSQRGTFHQRSVGLPQNKRL